MTTKPAYALKSYGEVNRIRLTLTKTTKKRFPHYWGSTSFLLLTFVNISVRIWLWNLTQSLVLYRKRGYIMTLSEIGSLAKSSFAVGTFSLILSGITIGLATKSVLVGLGIAFGLLSIGFFLYFVAACIAGCIEVIKQEAKMGKSE